MPIDYLNLRKSFQDRVGTIKQAQTSEAEDLVHRLAHVKRITPSDVLLAADFITRMNKGGSVSDANIIRKGNQKLFNIANATVGLLNSDENLNSYKAARLAIKEYRK